MTTLLDSNILLRLAEPDHAHHKYALDAVKRLRDQGHVLHIVPQVVYEYWVVATRSQEENGLGFSIDQAGNDIDENCVIFSLLRDERAILERWRSLVATHSVRGKTAHDARLVAAMQRHALTHILTFNKSDFARYPGITVLTPDEVVAGTA